MFTIIDIDMNAWTPERIRQLRDALKHTQRVFAEKIGVTREYVNYLEKGVRSPSKTMCILLDCMETKMKKKESGNRGKGKRNL